jgi:hypothetical protein
MQLVFFQVENYYLNTLKINSIDKIIFVIEAFRRFSEFVQDVQDVQDVQLLSDKFNHEKATLFTNLLTYNKTRDFCVPKYSFKGVKLKISVCSWNEMKQESCG